MTKEQRAQCVRLYLDGFTLDQLADFYDRERSIIDRLMGRAEVRRGHKFRTARRTEHGNNAQMGT